MPRYIVTAVYADVVDTPQVYEPGEIEAASAEEAERVAQDQCRDDNGWEPDSDDPLTDVYARRVGGEPCAEWHGYAVTEPQRETLTALEALLAGSFSEQQGDDVVIGKGHRRVRVEPDGTVHA